MMSLYDKLYIEIDKLYIRIDKLTILQKCLKMDIFQRYVQISIILLRNPFDINNCWLLDHTEVCVYGVLNRGWSINIISFILFFDFELQTPTLFLLSFFFFLFPKSSHQLIHWAIWKENRFVISWSPKNWISISTCLLSNIFVFCFKNEENGEDLLKRLPFIELQKTKLKNKNVTM